MDVKLAKDILLICKCRYDTEKHKSKLEAFNAYYHEHYGCDDITIDHKLVVNLFIKPSIEYFLTPDRFHSFVNNGLFAESISEKHFLNPNGCSDFYETIFNRLVTWLCLLDVNRYENGKCKVVIDLSEYPVDDKKWRGVI